MKFRILHLHVQTTEGPYEASLEFSDGLAVVWAENSMGKSTCVRAMLVALGMEATLTLSRSDLPLPPAVKQRLDSDHGEIDVIESEVFLEIENSVGERIVTQRTIKGARETNLITVHKGPILSQPGFAAISRGYFLNRDGSATREDGFHHFFATFIGWKLPLVQTFDGNERPLYLQCIFPYFVVEQTRGWSSLQPPVPTHFRIRDSQKRVVEFLLDLDAHRVAIRRQVIKSEMLQIQSDWKTTVEKAEVLAELASGTVQSLPQKPVTIWPPKIPPRIVVTEGDKWISLSERVNREKLALAELVEQEIPRVQEIASAAQAELSEAEKNIRERQTLLSRLLDLLESEQEEVKRVEHRVESISEDIQRHKDVKTLQQLKARQDSKLDTGHCPICHQVIQDSLLPLGSEQNVMSLEENIEFLKEQKRTFELVLENSKQASESRAAHCRTLNKELSSLRDQVRVLRQTLVSDGRLPSAAAIRTRIELESSIKQEELYEAQFLKSVDSFKELSKEWNRCTTELEGMPKEDVTAADKKKIQKWTLLVQEQLSQYGFRSFPTSQVRISEDTYRPEHDGFDLQVDRSNEEVKERGASSPLQNSISASDLIRTIWAYLNGVLELARTTETNHPGCILFDEPKQQSTRDVSFGELLRRSSKSIEHNQQVIFFTSENLQNLRTQLNGLKHSLIEIKGRVIKKKLKDNH